MPSPNPAKRLPGTSRYELMHVDIETRSRLNLKEVGAYRYAADKSTEARCAAYAFDDDPVQLWTTGQPVPKDVARHIRAGGKVLAHNASFERLIFREILGPRHGWPIPEIEQFRCSMAAALALALPGSLEDGGKAMSLEHLKDVAVGKRVMQQLTRPRKARKDEDQEGIYWHEDAARTKALHDYCMGDVATMREFYNSIWPLSDDEQIVWEMDQRINDRGFYVDEKLLLAMRKIIAAAAIDVNAQMTKLTGGSVETVDKVARLKTWLKKSCGVTVNSLSKTTIPELIADPKTPKLAKEVLELRLAGAQAATKKVDAFLDRRSADGRVHGAFRYHSAGTGRWSSHGTQVHNLKRLVEEDATKIEAAVGDLMTSDYQLLKTKYARPLQIVGDNIRTVICASPGHVLVGADFSGIEARITAWLAGEERKLKVFRDYDAGVGPDPYVVAAAGIYGIPATSIVKAQRQVGKGAELAFGFQGGVNAYKKFVAEGAFTDEEINGFKVRWRKMHPDIVALWAALKYASDKIAKQAVQIKRGVDRTIEPIPVQNVWFEYNAGFMFVVLPSGRRISYPDIDRAYRPREFSFIEKPADRDSSVGPLATCFMDNSSGRWHRVFLYGGMCCENLVQGIARDLLAEAMVRVEKAGLPIVGHVHDECLLEVPEKHADKIAKQFTRLMAELPDWALGTGHDLPVVAKPFIARRYVK